jgi:hypothetical protein
MTQQAIHKPMQLIKRRNKWNRRPLVLGKVQKGGCLVSSFSKDPYFSVLRGKSFGLRKVGKWENRHSWVRERRERISVEVSGGGGRSCYSPVYMLIVRQPPRQGLLVHRILIYSKSISWLNTPSSNRHPNPLVSPLTRYSKPQSRR